MKATREHAVLSCLRPWILAGWIGLFATPHAQAQIPVDDYPIWMTFGLGLSRDLDDSDPDWDHIGIGLSYAFEKRRLSGRLAMESLGGLFGSAVEEVHLSGSVGARLRSRDLHVAQFFGLALVHTKTPEEYANRTAESSLDPGLILTTQLFLRQLILQAPEVGCGLEVQALISPKSNFVGLRAAFLFHNTL